MKKIIITGTLTLIFLAVLSSCKKYLDVVPDNIATIDNAFTMRSQAEKYLFTCYSYMPNDGEYGDDPAMTSGDEIWQINERGGYFNIAKGFQNVVSPYGDRWTSLYQALRDCNIFLENINKVPDLDEAEKDRWIAEVKFLKAYYHFYLVRMYGPVPLIKTNLPISADVNQVKVVRDPVDSCFHYITRLIDEATPSLPFIINDPSKEAGRFTQPIALSFKARVLVTAASPLFNGNNDQKALKNPDGTLLFNPTFSKAKWDSAAIACKRAIDICHQAGMKLYVYNPSFQQYNLSDTVKTQLSLRLSVTEKWNSEIIWANTQTNSVAMQRLVATWWDPAFLEGTVTRGELSPPLKISEMFYSRNGVPITEDKTWDYTGRYNLRKSGTADKLHVRQDFVSAVLHFDREPRFYADLGFDGGIYYGQGKYDDKNDKALFYLEGKYKQRNGFGKAGYSTVTGYFIKKLVHYQNVIGASDAYSVTSYPWPIMRLSDLYLLYSEALNESQGPGVEVNNYIDLVRKRAGLGTVASSWTNFSTNPSKFTTQDGMREIIHRERLIELAFEAQRFWELRRWKESAKEMNDPIMGWDLVQATAAAYYRPTVIFNQAFRTKDYFWPIKDSYINVNRNIVQNTGW